MSVFSKPILAASGTAFTSARQPERPGAVADAGSWRETTLTPLPNIVVEAPKQTAGKQKQKPKTARGCLARSVPAVTPPTAPPTPVSPAEQLAAKGHAFDQARSNIYATIGTTSDTISHDTIQDLPGGTNQTVEQVLLAGPWGLADPAASGSLHIRNDHANLQYRINGVPLPDGVTGFGSIFDTSFIGSMSLVTGALPAEYGLRTVGLVDITTRTDLFNNSGSVGMYGGSHGTVAPSIEYGGTFGSTCPTTTTTTPGYVKATAASTDCFAGVQYYFTGRYLQNTVGIENPTPATNAIHDFTQQDKGFAYMSAFVDPTTRVSLIAGTSTNNFQIPNVPGQPIGQGAAPVSNAFGATSFNSAQLNENQTEFTQFGVLSIQKSVDGFDGQLSYFTRYNQLQFTPDPVGDLLLNGIASNVGRTSYTNGFQGDGSYQINSAHTLRAGFSVSTEQAFVGNTSLVEPCMACGRLRQRQTLSASPTTCSENRPADGRLCSGTSVKVTQPVQRSTPACASIRCMNLSAPTSSARGSAPPTSPSRTPRSMPAMHATSRRRSWWRRRPPISACSTTPQAQGIRPERSGSCRNARIITMPASIKRSNSDAPRR